MEVKQGRMLAIETAVADGSIALFCDGALVGEAYDDVARTENLLIRIDTLLDRENMRADEINAIAVSLGPGSYTGIRIGISTATGFARATGATLVGISVMEALAALSDAKSVLTIAPFGRKEAAMQRFVQGTRTRSSTGEPAVVELDRLPNILASDPVQDVVVHPAIDTEQLATIRSLTVSSQNMAELIARCALAGGRSEHLEPIYLAHTRYNNLAVQ